MVNVVADWGSGSLNGSLGPFVDVLGGIFSGTATALQTAINATNYNAQLLLPTSFNDPGSIQIDIYYTIQTSARPLFGPIFRADGAGNFYTVYWDPFHGTVKLQAMSPGNVTTGFNSYGPTFYIPPAQSTVGSTFLLRTILEPSGYVAAGGSQRLTVRLFNVTAGVVGSQLITDNLFFNTSTALQLSAQPTGGQVGIWCASSILSVGITKIAISNANTVGNRVDEGTHGQIPYYGINISGGSFVNPIYPTNAEIDYYLGAKGMNTFRFAFKWEFLWPGALVNQTYTNVALSSSVLAIIDARCNYAASKYPNILILMDLHDYASYTDGGRASGNIVFSANPAANSTITINGTVVTFVASGATGNQVNIGASLSATLASLQTMLSASADTNLILMTYAIDGTNTALILTSIAGGTTGNAYTLAASTAPASHGVVSQPTLNQFAPLGQVGSGLPLTALADFWSAFATHIAAQSYANDIVFGIMNEPTKYVTPADWVTAAQGAINAIRSAGCTTQQIWCAGPVGDSANSWMNPASSNSTGVMLGLTDPSNNLKFEVHQYFDASLAGVVGTVISETISVTLLWQVTFWARQNGKKLIIGEFATGGNAPDRLACLQNALQFMSNNIDVWYAWEYWSGGPWSVNYFTTMDPVPLPGGADRLQMPTLLQFIPLPQIPVLTQAVPGPGMVLVFDGILGKELILPLVDGNNAVANFPSRYSYDVPNPYGSDNPLPPTGLPSSSTLLASGLTVLLDNVLGTKITVHQIDAIFAVSNLPSRYSWVSGAPVLPAPLG